jgi:hypothetical protein
MLMHGCVSNANAILIPPFTPAGRRYSFDVVMTYSNNALQQSSVRLPSPVIEVR